MNYMFCCVLNVSIVMNKSDSHTCICHANLLDHNYVFSSDLQKYQT